MALDDDEKNELNGLSHAAGGDGSGQGAPPEQGGTLRSIAAGALRLEVFGKVLDLSGRRRGRPTP